MKKFLRYIVVLILFTLLISCSNSSHNGAAQNIKNNNSGTQKNNTSKRKFKYSPEDLKSILPKLEHFKFISEDMKEIRKKDFSVNMYEVNYSTFTIEEKSNINTQLLNIKILDIGDNMLYPPLVAYNIFYKFGIIKNSDLIYQDREIFENWKIVYNYDKIKKEGDFNALKDNVFIMMSISYLDIENSKIIFKKDILQKIDKN